MRAPSIGIPFAALVVALAGVLPGVAHAQTASEVRKRVLSLVDSMETRGEYEKTEDYERRVERQRRELERLVAGTYPDTVSVGFGRYRPDPEELPVRIADAGFATGGVSLVPSLVLDVPPRVAKRLKQGPGAPSPATGRFWVERDGTVYLEGRLTFRHGGRSFTTSASDTRVQVLGVDTLPEITLPRRSVRPEWMVTSPGGSYAAAGGDASSVLWDPTTGQVARELGGECGSPTFSGDERFFACARATRSDQLRVWVVDLEQGEIAELTDVGPRWRIPTLGGPNDPPAVAFEPTPGPSHSLLIEGTWGDPPDTQARLIRWAVDDPDADPGQSTNAFPIPASGRITEVEPSPDGEVAAVESEPLRASGGRCCDVGDRRHWIVDLGSGQPVGSARAGEFDGFLPGGDRYLSGRRILSTRSGETVAELEEAAVAGRHFISPDGRLVAAEQPRSGAENRTVLWDARTGEVVRRVRRTTPLAFFPDGDLYVGLYGERAFGRVALKYRWLR